MPIGVSVLVSCDSSKMTFVHGFCSDHNMNMIFTADTGLLESEDLSVSRGQDFTFSSLPH